jgi:hypothetical protein
MRENTMRQLTKLADRMLSRVVPSATAAACGGCTTTGVHIAGPCHGGYYTWRVCCSSVGPANTCPSSCTYRCA